MWVPIHSPHELLKCSVGRYVLKRHAVIYWRGTLTTTSTLGVIPGKDSETN